MEQEPGSQLNPRRGPGRAPFPIPIPSGALPKSLHCTAWPVTAPCIPLSAHVQPSRNLLHTHTTLALQISCSVACYSHAHVRASPAALLAHLRRHKLTYSPGKASCYMPKPSSLPHISTGLRPGCLTRSLSMGRCQEQLQSSPEHCWNRIRPACLSPCGNPEGSAAGSSIEEPAAQPLLSVALLERDYHSK